MWRPSLVGKSNLCRSVLNGNGGRSKPVAGSVLRPFKGHNAAPAAIIERVLLTHHFLHFTPINNAPLPHFDILWTGRGHMAPDTPQPLLARVHSLLQVQAIGLCLLTNEQLSSYGVQ